MVLSKLYRHRLQGGPKSRERVETELNSALAFSGFTFFNIPKGSYFDQTILYPKILIEL